MKLLTVVAYVIILFCCFGVVYHYTFKTPIQDGVKAEKMAPSARVKEKSNPTLQPSQVPPDAGQPHRESGAPETPTPAAPKREDTHTYGKPETTDLQDAWKRTDFYRTIIDNNLFLPLGTQPRRAPQRWRLLATITRTEAQSEALIQNMAHGDIQTVKVGDNVGDARVVDIQPKHLTLETAGHQTTLTLSPDIWLGDTR